MHTGKRTTGCEASAPGTLMLMGEHAVLHGHPALACATDQRIRVRIAPRDDACLAIESALGNVTCPLGDYTPCPPSLRFVRGTLEALEHPLETGLDIHIESDFPSTVGLGSSAAVTVALTAALRVVLGLASDPGTLFEQAFPVIRAVQGIGSGADVAASLLGGITRYRMQPRQMETIAATPPILLVYCGYKTPTPEVVARVQRLAHEQPETCEALFQTIGSLTEKAWEAVRRNDYAALGHLMNQQHELMEQLGLCTPELREIVETMRAEEHVYGAKISGSGLGDCALALGEGTWRLPAYERLPVQLSAKGLEVHHAT